MATLDFGMALARGMLPQSEAAQKDLLNLAGGRNVFKSEDWWNKQVDAQISKGVREKEIGTEYLTQSGEYKLGRRNVSYPSYIGGTKPIISYQAPRDAVITGYRQPPRGMLYGRPTPIYETRQVDVFGASGREDFTAPELKDIEKSAKRGAEQVKRTMGELKASKRRLSRATAGLMGKAKVGAPEVGPALGTTGLGIEDSILGGGIKL